MNKFNKFNNKNINAQSPQYMTFRSNKITELFKQSVIKVVTLEEVFSNTQIFSSCFVDKIMNPVTDNAYKKFCLVIQAYHN